MSDRALTGINPKSFVRFAGRAARAGGSRRGAAMMLVMIALGTASVLASTYVVSRNNASAIGSNAASATSSEWASRSAASAAVAILQTQTNWLGDADPTALLTNTVIAGAKVSVLVTDLDGNVPDTSDTDLLVTATAVIGNTRKVCQKVVRYAPATKPATAIDPYLGEYAVFSTASMTLDDGSTVASWGLSPAAKTAKKVRLGAGFTGSGSLTIGSAATLVNTSLVCNASATAGLKAKVADAKFVVGDTLPVDVPCVAASLPASLTGLATASATDKSYAFAATIAAGKYQSVTISGASAVVTLDAANGQNYSFLDLTINTQGVLKIKGNVLVHVRSDLNVMSRGTIEFADANSSATFYIADDLLIDDAAVGVDRTIARNVARSVASVAAYRQADRLKFIGLDALSGGVIVPTPSLNLTTKALAFATFHMPGSACLIDSNSGMIGRVSSLSLRCKTGTTLLYDAGLDNNAGFTSRSGPLYKDDGNPIDGLTTGLVTFNLTGSAQTLGTIVQSAVDLLGVVLAPDAGAGATPRFTCRASGRDWPCAALGLETASGGTTDTSGALVSNEVSVRLTAQKTSLIAAASD